MSTRTLIDKKKVLSSSLYACGDTSHNKNKYIYQQKQMSDTNLNGCNTCMREDLIID